jgi:hypothetical protein
MKDTNENVEKFIRTFHNGGYDAEFDDKLSADRDTPCRTGFPARKESRRTGENEETAARLH